MCMTFKSLPTFEPRELAAWYHLLNGNANWNNYSFEIHCVLKYAERSQEMEALVYEFKGEKATHEGETAH